MLKYLLPFGKTTTGILLNVSMYISLVFLVIYLPIYFSINEKTANNNSYIPIITARPTLAPQATPRATHIITRWGDMNIWDYNTQP